MTRRWPCYTTGWCTKVQHVIAVFYCSATFLYSYHFFPVPLCNLGVQHIVAVHGCPALIDSQCHRGRSATSLTWVPLSVITVVVLRLTQSQEQAAFVGVTLRVPPGLVIPGKRSKHFLRLQPFRFRVIAQLLVHMLQLTHLASHTTRLLLVRWHKWLFRKNVLETSFVNVTVPLVVASAREVLASEFQHSLVSLHNCGSLRTTADVSVPCSPVTSLTWRTCWCST